MANISPAAPGLSDHESELRQNGYVRHFVRNVGLICVIRTEDTTVESMS